ncbi:MAG: ABC transporter permease [Methylococcaceae bacterium]
MTLYLKAIYLLSHQVVDNFEQIIIFVKRDIAIIRADTKLGFFWVVFPPLVPLTVFIGLASLGVISRSADMPFVMFIVIGITIYRYIADFIKTTINIFRSERTAIKNYSVPLVVLIFSKNAMTFFHFIFRLVIVSSVVFYYGVEVKLDWLFLPLFFIIITLFSFSIGVLIAFKNLLYKDYGKGMDMILVYVFFISSVVFPFPKTGVLGAINKFNPFNTFVDSARGLFYFGIEYVDLTVFGITTLYSVIFFCVACKMIYLGEAKIRSVM